MWSSLGPAALTPGAGAVASPDSGPVVGTVATGNVVGVVEVEVERDVEFWLPLPLPLALLPPASTKCFGKSRTDKRIDSSTYR